MQIWRICCKSVLLLPHATRWQKRAAHCAKLLWRRLWPALMRAFRKRGAPAVLARSNLNLNSTIQKLYTFTLKTVLIEDGHILPLMVSGQLTTQCPLNKYLDSVFLPYFCVYLCAQTISCFPVRPVPINLICCLSKSKWQKDSKNKNKRQHTIQNVEI